MCFLSRWECMPTCATCRWFSMDYRRQVGRRALTVFGIKSNCCTTHNGTLGIERCAPLIS